MASDGKNPWILHFHTSVGCGETFIRFRMRFRTRREARDFRNEMRYGNGLVFYPIYKEKPKVEEP